MNFTDNFSITVLHFTSWQDKVFPLQTSPSVVKNTCFSESKKSVWCFIYDGVIGLKYENPFLRHHSWSLSTRCYYGKLGSQVDLCLLLYITWYFCLDDQKLFTTQVQQFHNYNLLMTFLGQIFMGPTVPVQFVDSSLIFGKFSWITHLNFFSFLVSWFWLLWDANYAVLMLFFSTVISNILTLLILFNQSCPTFLFLCFLQVLASCSHDFYLLWLYL